jgi:predicted glycosyltransferase
MRVWYDACTGKQIRYGSAIGKRLQAAGHEFIFTTRKHPDTVPLAKIIGEKPIVVGKYDPSTLTSRLKESAERVILFADMFKTQKPDVAVAHQSVELCRTAFGLGIPIVLTADTPYALATNRLTIPFAHTVIFSEALPKSFTRQYGAKNTISFRGVDEVAWIKDFKPQKPTQKKKPIIMLRQMETQAAYVQHRKDNAESVAAQLGCLGDVRLFERYNVEGSKFSEKPTFVDTLNLVASADLVVSYGGTVAREAALLGVPSIAISDMAKTNVNRYVAKKGFPLFITDEKKLFGLAQKYLGKRFDVQSKLAQLEDPVDTIEKVVESLKPKQA